MKIINQNPPNISEIERYLEPSKYAIFCYGDTIFNPSGGEIPEDIVFHESIHERQQKLMSSPSFWWTRYLTDRDFRQNQEVEAYAEQLLFVKKHIPRAYKEALSEFSDILSSKMYNLNINKHQAETLIRIKTKSICH